MFLTLVPCSRLVAAPRAASHHFDEQNAILNRSNRPHVDRQSFVGDRVCGSCHETTLKTYLETRHHRTSQLADEASIAGKFGAGENRMKTLNPELSFRMDAKNGRFYQTAILAKRGHAAVRSESFDIVVGSGRKGQTYLYWKNDGLYELPVSYWTELKRWINSPGYVDGSADFDRPVTPRCVECHATYFQALGPSPTDNLFNKRNFVLGISCERCHGPGADHVRQQGSGAQRANDGKGMAPVGLTREEQIDVCAQCHGSRNRSGIFFCARGTSVGLHQPAPPCPRREGGCSRQSSSSSRKEPLLSVFACNDVLVLPRSTRSRATGRALLRPMHRVSPTTEMRTVRETWTADRGQLRRLPHASAGFQFARFR